MGDLRILKDPTRALELHHLKGLKHADGMLIAYLPNEKIVVQADMAFIGPFQLGADERRTATLVENLERLKLDYETVDSRPGCRPLELAQTRLREERHRHRGRQPMALVFGSYS